MNNAFSTLQASQQLEQLINLAHEDIVDVLWNVKRV